MKTITYEYAPSLVFNAFEAPHGALLPDPVVLLDVDSLPALFRIDKAQPFQADLDVLIDPYADSFSFSTNWRACTPGSRIVVALRAGPGYQWGTVYAQSSADGATPLDSVGVGNLAAAAEVGFRFSTTQPFYRILVGASEPGRVSLWTQQLGVI